MVAVKSIASMMQMMKTRELRGAVDDEDKSSGVMMIWNMSSAVIEFGI